MLFSSLVAGVTTALFMPLAISVLGRMRVLDLATPRSSHSGAALRGTGVALICGVIAGMTVAALTYTDNWLFFLACLLVGVLAGFLGLVEDIRGLAIRSRLFGQLLLSSLLGFFIVYTYGTIWIFLPIIALLCTAYINISNFMDGLNGMSGMHGGVAGLTFLAVGLIADLAWLTASGGILAAVFLVFLPWNLRRQGTFLGDSGSYLLGATHVSLACAAAAAGIPLMAAFSSTAIYVADTMATLAVRMKKGEKLAESHREHVYQRLNNLGWSHIRVSLTTACFSALTSVCGLISLRGDTATALIALAVICIFVVLYIALPSLVQMSKPHNSTLEDEGNSR